MSLFFALPPMSDWTFKPVFDIRGRVERRVDKDFKESVPDNRTDLLSRWRAGVDFSFRDQYTGRITYQFAHSEFRTTATTDDDERSDILFAYVDANAMDGKLRLGRQPIAIGTERLLGSAEWTNTGRSYDGVRWTGKGWDFFGARLAVNPIPSKDAYVAGAAYQGKWGDSLYVFKHDEKSSSHDDIHTLDHVWKFKVDKWSGHVELAGQLGRIGDRKLEAWASAARAEYQHDPKLKFYGEVAVASGGGDGDTTRTFNQLYATLHGKYGIMDMQGWRNMTGISLGVNYKPTSKLSLSAEFHKFGLYAANDAWYSDPGAPNTGFLDPTGNSGKDVGQEFDFYGSYAIDEKSQLEGGFGIFQPGGFIESFPGRGKEQIWGYLQYRIRY